MTVKNKIYNWLHRVKRLYRKGCRNCGIVYFEDELAIVKYDWSKPVTFVTKPIKLV